MITFWIREIAGWLLVLVSLFLLRTGFVFITDLDSPKIVEAAVVFMAALGVMRAGILLVRVATAARVCSMDSKG